MESASEILRSLLSKYYAGFKPNFRILPNGDIEGYATQDGEGCRFGLIEGEMLTDSMQQEGGQLIEPFMGDRPEE